MGRFWSSHRKLCDKGGTAHTESGNYGATQTIADNVPIKVFRNGEDMTFQMTYGDPTYAIYEVPADALTNATWEVSYDTSHRQTIYRKGGTGEVEMAYGYLSNDINVPLAQGFTTVDLPAYNYNAGNTYAEFSIEYVAGEKVKIYRNNEDVTNAFGEPQTLQGKQYYYITDANTGPNTQNAYGFILRDPATWEIVIEESHKMLNAYANNDVIVEYIKMVDGEQQSVSGQANAMHKWVNEGETYVVRFTPQHGEELTRFDIGWNAIDIENDSRLVRNDDGSYSFTISYDEMNEKNFDIMAVFGGATTTGRTMLVSSAGSKWVKAKVTHSDGTVTNVGNPIANGVVSCTVGDGDTFEVFASTSTDNPLVAVKLNGVDVTNNTDYLKQKDDLWWNYNFSSVSSDAVIELVYANSIYDVNRDNNINISDVTKLVNKILEKNPNDN